MISRRKRASVTSSTRPRPVELLLADGTRTGIFIVREIHDPAPEIEHDVFPNTVGQVLLDIDPASNAVPLVMPAGTDYFQTPANGTAMVLPAIPAGFFGQLGGVPSDAVSTRPVPLVGTPRPPTQFTGSSLFVPDDNCFQSLTVSHCFSYTTQRELADTVVERKEDIVLNNIGDTASVPIEIVSLSLTSVEPIQVTYGGSNPQFFDIFVDLAEDTTQPSGEMVATRSRTAADTGSSNTTLPVAFKSTFTNRDSGGPSALGTVSDNVDLVLNDNPFSATPFIVTPNPLLPPTDGVYRTPQQLHAQYSGRSLDIILQDIRHRAFGPPRIREFDRVTGNEQEIFDTTLTGTASVNGQSTQLTLSGPVTTVVRDKQGRPTGSFETEMISMDLRGDVPGVGSVAIRENPNQASLGRTTISSLGDRTFNVDSFFDVWTEISIDGGSTWIPATSPTKVELAPPPELVSVIGPTTVDVFLEGPAEGDAFDDDGNLLDEVMTEIVSMDLSGSSRFGAVQVRLNPDERSLGKIEEQVNNVPHRLELPPFTIESLLANSNFLVHPEIVVGGRVLRPAQGLPLATVINHKPPQGGESYINPFALRVELLDANGNPTGIFVTREIHQPDGPIEHDSFETTTALIQLVGSVPQAFILKGPSKADVFFEGRKEGDARDDDGDGLDEVSTELVSMDLAGGGVTLRVRDAAASPFGRSRGQIEEKINATPNQLDLDPFHKGDANSFFDVFFEIEVGGQKLHNQTPLRIESMIGEKPPQGGRYIHIVPPGGGLALLDDGNNAIGVFIVSAEHNTGAVEIDRFENTRAIIALDLPGVGEVTGIVNGPSEVHVFFEGNKEGLADDDDGNKRDEVLTRMAVLDLTGSLPGIGPVIFRVNPDVQSLGVIEEHRNFLPGTLDLPPFSTAGTADSFFDVFFEVELPNQGLILRNRAPSRMQTTIAHKPPDQGERYIKVDGRIPLYDAQGNVRATIVRASHQPGDHFVEHDHFEETEAEFTLIDPAGVSNTITLRGPTWIDVWFETREGQARDDDGDGLDEVMTKMIQLDLRGDLPTGPVQVRLNPNLMSVGDIEEKVNNTPGTLDIAPFTDSGGANSWFDVFFEIEVPNPTGGRLVLQNEQAKKMHAMIFHEPPGPGAVYENPDTIPLLLPNGQDSGFKLGPGKHVPQPHFAEHDHFEETTAQINLLGPSGLNETIQLRGPTWVDVWFERREGEARDNDASPDGLDEVMTKMVGLDLSGNSSLGPVHVTLNPNMMTVGEIEEKVNNTPGVLDIPPFTNVGAANSFFDVFFQIEVAGQKLVNQVPKRLQSMITHKPPGPGDVYESPTVIPLFTSTGDATEFRLGPARHTPNGHFVEHDHFEETETQFSLLKPDGSSEVVDLRGPTWIDVWFESREGEARNDDPANDTLDEVMTRVTGLDLRGQSSMGNILVTLNPTIPSTGEIEERENLTPGVLDLAPFADRGVADSFFDLWLQVEVVTPNGERLVLIAEEAKRMRSVIQHQPPGPGDTYENPDTIRLLLPDGTDSGFAIGPGRHVPNGHFVEHDHFEETEARVTLEGPFGTETIIVRGPTWVDVWFERREGEAHDNDGNGRDEVMTEMLQMDLYGESPNLGPVIVTLNPGRKTIGQIEERTSNIPGLLELPPFINGPGAADSFFDVFVQIDVPNLDLRLHNNEPKRISTVIDHKPPRTGTVYVSPTRIELFNEKGETSNVFLTSVHHTPVPHFVEQDHFEETEAQIALIGPSGTETITLRGPTWVDVWFERREGEARGNDGDGLDDVMTKMTQLDLWGTSSLGPVHVMLNPGRMTTGEIEEKINRTPGILDIPPFTDIGGANSFFDVFFQIEVGDQVLVNQEPKRLSSMILHKPPEPGAVYESPETIPLFDAAGNTTPFALGPARHIPNGHFVERDHFEETFAEISLINPSGGSETIQLTGPTWVDVWFERREGEARDNDGDGLEEVMTKMTGLDLRGSSSLGPVHVGLNSARESTGEIEEQVNNTPGVLDVAPFTDRGLANSTFDLWLVVTVPGPDGPLRLVAEEPKQLKSVIRHKPPGPGDVYETPNTINLLLPNGTPSGFQLGPGRHVPNGHFVEQDHFEETEAVLTFESELFGTQTITVRGPTWVDVWFERREGEARDNDGDQRDEVMTKMRQMDLRGIHPTLGPVTVTLNPGKETIGEIEEQTNIFPGLLELPPFIDGPGTADSFFDVFVQVDLPNQRLRLHNNEPKRISTVIDHKPPGTGTVYVSPGRIELFNDQDQPTGVFLTGVNHTPVPHFVEHDHFEETQAQITLLGPNSLNETIQLRGPTWVDVWFERREGEALDDDGDGLDEVMTKMQQLDLWGTSCLGPVHVTLDPGRMTTGEIEEKVNNNPGWLNLDPFHPGDANSFFDVFFKIEVAGQVLFNTQPKHMETMITEKPPGIGDAYESPEIIPLVDQIGNDTGFRLGPARHVPRDHFVEHDHFEETSAQVELINRLNGTSEIVQLTGPTWIDVWFESKEGEARDDDTIRDGLDEVMTIVQALDLRGSTAAGMPVHVGLNPAQVSSGQIEEITNNTPGVLDLPPFTGAGMATSFFDLWLQVTIIDPNNGRLVVLTDETPKHMSGVITEKPPGAGNQYESPEVIRLLLPNGDDSGFSIGVGRHVPKPRLVQDSPFREPIAFIEIATPAGNESIPLVGPRGRLDVFYEPNLGQAQDDSGNGLDKVQTRVSQLQLFGLSPSLGALSVTLHPGVESFGDIEEQVNLNVGQLDIRPFQRGLGIGNLHLSMQIDTAQQSLCTMEPFHLDALLSNVAGNDLYQGADPVLLGDCGGNRSSGISLQSGRFLFASVPGRVEVDTRPTGGETTLFIRNDDVVFVQNGQEIYFTDKRVVQTFVVNNQVGNQTHTLDFANGNLPPTEYAGSGTDTLQFVNGSLSQVIYDFLNGTDGNVRTDGTDHGFTGLLPIIDNLAVVDRLFVLPGTSDIVTLDTGLSTGDNILRIDSNNSELVDFTTPTGSLTVQLGDGDDTLLLDLDTVPAIDGQGGSNRVNLVGEGRILDLQSIADTDFTNVTTIDISGTLTVANGNRLNLDVNEVKNISAASDELTVLAGPDDIVDFGGGWRVDPNERTRVQGSEFFAALEQDNARLLLSGPYDWRNPVSHLDANSDGQVVVGDAARIVNELNNPTVHAING